MTNRKQPQRGMILLIVLGMLALFSLLAVTYVVFSGQARVTSVALANRDYRGTSSTTLMDQVVKQVVRGTQDSRSALWGHSLGEDLYGRLLDNNGNPIAFTNAGIQVGNWPSDSAMQRNAAALYLGNQYLRFPIRLPNDDNAGTPLPIEEDSLRNRIITFVEGPLSGMSFRVTRHVTEDVTQTPPTKLVITPADPVPPAIDPVAAVFAPQNRVMDQYLYIDISDAPNAIVSIPGTPSRQMSLREAAANIGTLASLFYQTPAIGYRFYLNPSMRSGTGYGRINPYSGNIDAVQLSTLNPTEQRTSVAFLNHFGEYLNSLPNGETNETYDAADYNDFFLSYVHANLASSADVIPSFHRPEIINFLANRINYSSLTAPQVLRLLQLVDYAMPRPLSMTLSGVNAADIDGNWKVPYDTATKQINLNPLFSAANPGFYPAMTPYLEMNLSQSLASGSPNIINLQNFLRWCAYGPWDVDNDGDGITDSVWIDPNLPLITSPEGKLLKVLTALQIEDLDGRLNVNAAGSIAQNDPLYYQTTNNSYGVGPGRSLPQGFGYGPAEISLAHLTGVSGFPNLLQRRYTPRRSIESPVAPGQAGVDLAAMFGARGRLDRLIAGNPVGYLHGTMPSLRLATHGEEAIGIDWNGQPLMMRGTNYAENINSPYESHLLSEAASDTPFNLEELERVIRSRDRDYSMLPDRLESVVGGNATPLAVRRAITTRSVDLTDAEVPAQDAVPQTPTSLFRETVRNLLQQRGATNLSEAHFKELFPFEFRHGTKININRAFGDGLDNDSDGQIDEWDEWIIVGSANGNVLSQLETYFDTTVGTTFPVSIDNYVAGAKIAGAAPNYDPTLDPGLEPKQLFARQLYCLAQLIVPVDYVFVGSPTNNPSDGATEQYRARRIAQWAINVVDYRDADVAMTRFMYDVNPFDSGAWQAQAADVVWGMEQPELLLRESIAFHDYRVKDTAVDDDKRSDMNDTDPAKRDDDPDQYLLPLGSLFLELYCPRTLSAGDTDLSVPGVPSLAAGNNNQVGLFRRDASQQVYLDLAAMSPPPANAATNPYGRQPVWRVVIAKMHEKQGIPTPNQVYSGAGGPRGRNDITYQLYSNAEANANGLYYNAADRNAAVPEIERIVWFTTEAQADPTTYTRIPGLPATASPREHIYFNRTGVTRLDGGSHLVIGPRADMHLGSEAPNPTNVYQPSEQRLQLFNNEMRITDLSGNTTSSAEVKPITGMIVAALPPAGAESQWADVYPEYGASGGIGLNISEPLPRPATAPRDERYYRLPTTQLNTSMGSGYEDDPVESWHDFAAPAAPFLPDEPFDKTATMLPPRMHNVGTYRDVTTAFLQRLADPEREYDVKLNPYITVDWIPIDLTTFSGEDSVQGIGQNPTITDQIHFTSRSRSGHDAAGSAQPTGYDKSALFTFTTIAPNNTTVNGSSQVVPPNQVYFDHQLVRNIAIPGIPGNLRSTTLGYLNKEFGIPQGAAAQVYVGHPLTPYATHFWLNRQFANTLELMSVPGSHPGQFGQEFTTYRGGNDPNDPTTESLLRPFGHLMAFFSSTQFDFSKPPPYMGKPGADMARMLALVETPSPWIDSAKWSSPTVSASNPELSQDRPPFNSRSTFRTPGKVNVNTIASPSVWMGLEGNAFSSTDRLDAANNRLWGPLELSRRGYAPNAGVLGAGLPTGGAFPHNYINHLNDDFPTQFAGVFRSPWHSHLAPELSGGTRYALRQAPNDATLLRRNPSDLSRPLLFDSANPQDPNRYSFTAHQSVSRLQNLLTTHSNVFSVRMTLGYFEVDQLTGQIGREYRSDVGRNERNHGFFIIDRSIPAGFYPGVDLNTDKTILVRRYFE